MDWQVLTGGRLADAAAGGLIVLAAGSLAARLCRQPVRRARLIVLSLLGALAVPCLGALPVAPRWSAGLLAAPAAILVAPTMRRSAEAREPTRTRPRRPDRESPSGPSSSPERRRRATPDRTRPRSVGADGVRASRPGGLSPPRGRSCSGLFRRGGRAGGLVARRAGPALARDPVGSARPGGRSATSSSGSPGPRGERVVLLESDRIALPFTYTWRRPVILLPVDALRRGRARGPPLRPGARVVARRAARRLGVEPRLPGGARPLLSTAVLVAEAAAPPLPGLPGRRPGRRRGLGRGLRRVPRPPRAGPQVRPGRPRRWGSATAARTSTGGSSCSCRTTNRWSAAAGPPGASPPPRPRPS